MFLHVLLAFTSVFKDSGFCFRSIYCRFDLIVKTAAIITVMNIFVMQTRFVLSFGSTCHKIMGVGVGVSLMSVVGIWKVRDKIFLHVC